MTTTTGPLPQERDDTIRMERRFRPPAVPMVVAWWRRQTHPTRTGLAVAAVFALAGTFSLGVSLTRPAQAEVAKPATAAALKQETKAPDAGRVWIATKSWQGTGAKETETFTVSGHWRVDWIFSPSGAASGAFQVYIYSADGRQLMNLAANSQKGGSDTSFWAGPGTYFLKINSSGGDWKVGVQDLR